MVSSRNSAWFKEGVTTLTRGHGDPSDREGGSGGVATVQGHPVRPGGGEGSSSSAGQGLGPAGWFNDMSNPIGGYAWRLEPHA